MDSAVQETELGTWGARVYKTEYGKGESCGEHQIPGEGQLLTEESLSLRLGKSHVKGLEGPVFTQVSIFISQTGKHIIPGAWENLSLGLGNCPRWNTVSDLYNKLKKQDPKDQNYFQTTASQNKAKEYLGEYIYPAPSEVKLTMFVQSKIIR